jgi:hypothetical protein
MRATKRHGGSNIKNWGGKSSDLRLGRLKLYQVEEDSFSESRESGLSLHGDDSYKYAPSDISQIR